MNKLQREYNFDWVLINELAISRAPKTISDLQFLKRSGIVSILSLCSISEVKSPKELESMFNARRIVLPDHKYKRKMTLDELNFVLDNLSNLLDSGPVLVHCVAAVERSPIVCMGWLVRNNGLSPQEALDYLMQAHPGTSPLSNQFSLLNNIRKIS